LLITSGTQQAMSLVTRVLLDPGDEVVMEDPQYPSPARSSSCMARNVTGVPVDRDGLCVDALPPHPVKLVCVTPSHQFPTGAVLSLPRRQQLLEYARQCGSWIVEDDYDGEFRQDEHAVPALQSLDRNGCVIYVGSYSKTLFRPCAWATW
jgi:GntR family transcriptional regulator/MocR family aminotransferase